MSKFIDQFGNIHQIEDGKNESFNGYIKPKRGANSRALEWFLRQELKRLNLC